MAVARCCPAAVLRRGGWRCHRAATLPSGPRRRAQGGGAGSLEELRVPSTNICSLGVSPAGRAEGWWQALLTGLPAAAAAGQKAARAATCAPGTCTAHLASARGVSSTPVRRCTLYLPLSAAPSRPRAPTTLFGGGVSQTATARAQRPPCRGQVRVSTVVCVRVPGPTGPRPPVEGGVARSSAKRGALFPFLSLILSIGVPSPPPLPLLPLQWGPRHRKRRWRRGSLRLMTPPPRPMLGGAASCPRCTRPPAGGTRPPSRKCSEAARRRGWRRTRGTRPCTGLPLGGTWR